MLLKHGQSPSLAQLDTFPSSSRQVVSVRRQVRDSCVDGSDVNLDVIDLTLGLGNGAIDCDVGDAAGDVAADGASSFFERVAATTPPAMAKMINRDRRMPLARTRCCFFLVAAEERECGGSSIS
jgi:hypothetical protein